MKNMKFASKNIFRYNLIKIKKICNLLITKIKGLKMVKEQTRLILKPCKLINVKNNCFFNSSIQLTLYVYPIVKYFESASFESKQVICKSFQNFIKSYAKKDVLDPQKFIDSISNKIRIFNGEEQDAQEFILLFYNKLAEELGLLDNMQISTKNELRKIGRINIMVKTFYGIISNEILCTGCSHKSVFRHQFSNLTLHVTESIKESVEKFLTTEINPSETKCDGCKKKSNVMVKKEFRVLPEVLVIQLSRYHRNRKNDNFVIINENLEIGDKLYRPIGFICHSGTLENGHYTAYAKVDTKWYLFDDASVHEVAFENCNKKGAYILFYSRI